MIFFLYHKTNLLIGIMNKNIIQIGSLCIVILLLMGVLYVMKRKEGFVATPATQDPELLVKAKQAVGTATAAVTAATRAVGTPAETSTAKDAYSKATLAVTAANSAVTDTMGALKAVLGLQDVSDPSMDAINGKITAIDGFAANAKRTWEAAEANKTAKNPAEKKRLSDAAAADRDAKKRTWEALPN
jgi:hypothetical protein